MNSFSNQLKALRANANLTIEELAELADVPAYMISGLQNDTRRVGKHIARRLGRALKLTGALLQDFVSSAMDTSTESGLRKAKPYPSLPSGFLAARLSRAGIPAESIRDFNVLGDEHGNDIKFTLDSGNTVTLKTKLVFS